MNNSLISIIIPVYNIDSYLKECLDSILVQTYQNFEIILVDDGSTDSSFKICNEYAYKDKRIKIYQQNNQGSGIARNTGLKFAKGNYVTYIDGDDFIPKNYLEVLLSFASNDTIPIAYHMFLNSDEYNVELNDKYKRIERIIQHKDILKEFFLDPTYTGAWGKLIPIEYMKDLSFPTGILEDVPVTYKILLKANKLVVTNMTNYLYRIREGSIMNENNDEKYFNQVKRTFQVLSQLKEEKFKYYSLRSFYAWQLEICMLCFLRPKKTKETKKDLSRVSWTLRIHFFRYFFSMTNANFRLKLILNFFAPHLLRKISFYRQRYLKEKKHEKD